MKLFRYIFILFTATLLSCGFGENLPCRGSDCDTPPEEVPNTENEG